MNISALRRLNFILTVAVMALAAAAHGAERPPVKPPSVPAELPPEIETLQPGVKLTLLAEHPALVTPTGIGVDARGRIWAVSSHTHFRPEGYAGPEHDEVLMFDSDGGGRKVFYNRTKATMDLEPGRDGWVYLAERGRILRVKDSDGDGTGDTEETLATLETEADYPHNGLAGIAWHPSGDLIFSLGRTCGNGGRSPGATGRASAARAREASFAASPTARACGASRAASGIHSA
jgi:hypothetical protein